MSRACCIGMVWLLGVLGTIALPDTAQAVVIPLSEAKVVSTVDQTPQPIRYYAPGQTTTTVPLLVSLHSWSGDYHQDHSKYVDEAGTRGWAFVEPNFRGKNDHTEACGSPIARQDILDAIDWMIQNHRVNPKQVYVVGESGGGMMTLLMAGYHPERFAAASAWVPISDLAEWERFHFKNGQPDNYAKQTVQCCGGRPGASEAVDAEYKQRSALTVLHRVGALPLDINAGVTDGKTGSVPFQHSLRAFNVVAKAHGTNEIPEGEMDELWKDGRLAKPGPQDEAEDATYGRKIFLRRSSNAARVTIFDGGHEGLPKAACAWLAKQPAR